MSDKKLTKRAKRFLGIVIDKTKQDPSFRRQESVRFFQEAVNALPDGTLKQELKTNLSSYVKQFNSSIGDALNCLGDDVLPYNLFVKNGYKVDDSGLDAEQKRKAYTCLLMERIDKMNKEKTLEKRLQKCQDPEEEDDPENTPWLKNIHLLCSILIYKCEPSTLQKTMKLFHKNMLNSVEICISKHKLKRLERLQTESLQFLYFCHMFHEQLEQSFTNPTYGECVSGILGVYFDMLVALNGRESDEKCESSAKRFAGVVLYLLHNMQDQLIDLLLPQATLSLTSPATVTALDMFLPLAQRALVPPSPIDHVTYTKYIAAVRHMQKLYPMKLGQETQKAYGVGAPGDYLSWIEDRNADILDNLPVTAKFKHTRITQFLLDEPTDELTDQLLDILMDSMTTAAGEEAEEDEDELSPKKRRKRQQKEVGKQLINGTAIGGEQEEQPMFYMDKAKDMRTAKQIKRELGLGKKQLRTEDSDSEGEMDDLDTEPDKAIDVSFDEQALMMVEEGVDTHSMEEDMDQSFEKQSEVNLVKNGADLEDAQIVCITPLSKCSKSATMDAMEVEDGERESDNLNQKDWSLNFGKSQTQSAEDEEMMTKIKSPKRKKTKSEGGDENPDCKVVFLPDTAKDTSIAMITMMDDDKRNSEFGMKTDPVQRFGGLNSEFTIVTPKESSIGASMGSKSPKVAEEKDSQADLPPVKRPRVGDEEGSRGVAGGNEGDGKELSLKRKERRRTVSQLSNLSEKGEGELIVKRDSVKTYLKTKEKRESDNTESDVGEKEVKDAQSSRKKSIQQELGSPSRNQVNDSDETAVTESVTEVGVEDVTKSPRKTQRRKSGASESNEDSGAFSVLKSSKTYLRRKSAADSPVEESLESDISSLTVPSRQRSGNSVSLEEVGESMGKRKGRRSISRNDESVEMLVQEKSEEKDCDKESEISVLDSEVSSVVPEVATENIGDTPKSERKRRGRPAKVVSEKLKQDTDEVCSEDSERLSEVQNSSVKRRGRPSRASLLVMQETESGSVSSENDGSVTSNTPVQKRRGRPPKTLSTPVTEKDDSEMSSLPRKTRGSIAAATDSPIKTPKQDKDVAAEDKTPGRTTRRKAEQETESDSSKDVRTPRSIRKKAIEETKETPKSAKKSIEETTNTPRSAKKTIKETTKTPKSAKKDAESATPKRSLRSTCPT